MATTTSTTETKKLQVTELDFDQIKTNLKQFLKNQSEFADYDFEGSGMAVLLDLLAYNTHYLGFNANMAANEAFLDSAELRSSVVSLSKMLGYTPSSAVSPKAIINLVLTDATGSSVTMPAGTKFTTTVDNDTYTYVTNSDNTITLSNTTGNDIVIGGNAPTDAGFTAGTYLGFINLKLKKSVNT